MNIKAHTIALLLVGAAFTAQSQASCVQGQTYDPAANYYETYYGIMDSRANTNRVQSQDQVCADTMGLKYDPIAIYYETYYGQ